MMTHHSPVPLLERSFRRDLISLVFATLWGGRGLSMIHAGQVGYAILTLACCLTGLAVYWRDTVHGQCDRILVPGLERTIRWTRIVGIAVVVGLCRNGPYEAFLLPGISLVIGATRVLEARAVDEVTYLPTGVGVVIVSVMSFVFPGMLHGAIAGIGTAIVLWVGLLVRLLRGMTAHKVQTVPDVSV